MQAAEHHLCTSGLPQADCLVKMIASGRNHRCQSGSYTYLLASIIHVLCERDTTLLHAFMAGASSRHLKSCLHAFRKHQSMIKQVQSLGLSREGHAYYGTRRTCIVCVFVRGCTLCNSHFVIFNQTSPGLARRCLFLTGTPALRRRSNSAILRFLPEARLCCLRILLCAAASGSTNTCKTCSGL